MKFSFLERLKTSKQRSVLDVLTSIALISVSLVLVYDKLFRASVATSQNVDIPAASVSLDGAQLRGSQDSPAVMIVYSDFECPFCTRFAREVLPLIEDQYVAVGKVAVAFRHLPLRIHAQARRAAAVAECAGRQGRFWEMHDRLFAETLTEESLRDIPKSMTLDHDAFGQCLKDENVARKVDESVTAANALGITGTPTFLMGRREDDGQVKVLSTLSGVKTITQFAKHFDAILRNDRKGWRSWVPFVNNSGGHGSTRASLVAW
jgi:protein-disulfide isomerase